MAGLLDNYMAQVQDYKKAGSIGSGLLPDRPNLELGRQGLLGQMQAAESEYLKRVSDPLPYYQQNPEAQGLLNVSPELDLIDAATGGGKMAMVAAARNMGKKAGSGIVDDMGRYVDGLRYNKDEYDSRYSPRKAEEALFKPKVNDSGKMASVSRMALQDLEGKPYVTTMSDRTAAGGILEGIGDKDLKYGVPLTGGQDYMRTHPDMWASGSSVTPQMMKAATEMQSRTGENPIFMPWRMAPTGGDFAHKTGQTMLSYAAENMPIKVKKSLNSDIKKIIPDWVGVDDPRSMDQYGSIPDKVRKKLMNHMDKNYRDKGGISITQARLAVSDQSQLNAPVSGFQNVGMFDMDRGSVAGGGNATYPSSVGGDYLGTLDTDVTAMDLNPERLARAMNRRGEFTSGPQGTDLLSTREAPRRAMEVGTWGGVISEDLIRSLADKGFKIDSNGVITAISATGAGLLGLNANQSDSDSSAITI
tara:strand:+ start:849 stop:2270 length:1422 start_codon:yes stop_codon:yes gene_type:complete